MRCGSCVWCCSVNITSVVGRVVAGPGPGQGWRWSGSCAVRQRRQRQAEPRSDSGSAAMAATLASTFAHQQGVARSPVRAGAHSLGAPQVGQVGYGLGCKDGRQLQCGGPTMSTSQASTSSSVGRVPASTAARWTHNGTSIATARARQHGHCPGDECRQNGCGNRDHAELSWVGIDHRGA